LDSKEKVPAWAPVPIGHTEVGKDSSWRPAGRSSGNSVLSIARMSACRGGSC
jgi:hypothetical protein